MTRARLAGWIIGSLAALIVVVFLAAILVLRSRRFHEYVLSRIISRVEQATSAQVEIEDYSFDWSKLGANIRKMTVHGAEPASAAPLFTADNIWIGFKIISALQRKID